MNMENLEQVKVLTPKEILGNLTQINFETSEATLACLVKDITALLISYNTVTGKVNESLFAVNAIRELLTPLIDQKYIQFSTQPVPNKTHDHYLPFIFINSPEEEELVAKIVKIGQKDLPPIYVDLPLLLAHIDTTPIIDPYGGLKTYIDNQENPLNSLMTGRGANDEKSQVAVIIMMLYLLHSIGQKPPLTFIVDDEEHSVHGSKVYLNSIIPRDICVEVEPCDPRLFFNETWPATILEYKIGSQKQNLTSKFFGKKYMDVLKDIESDIASLAEFFYPEPQYDVLVFTELGRITVSVVDVKNYTAPIMNEDFSRAVSLLVDSLFIVNEYQIGDIYYLQSETSPKYKKILGDVLSRRIFTDDLKPNRQIVKIREEKDILRRGSIMHDFMCMSGIVYGALDLENIVSIGPRELGNGRHSNLEVVKIGDDVVLYKHLSELFTGGEKVFTEA